MRDFWPNHNMKTVDYGEATWKIVGIPLPRLFAYIVKDSGTNQEGRDRNKLHSTTARDTVAPKNQKGPLQGEQRTCKGPRLESSR